MAKAKKPEFQEIEDLNRLKDMMSAAGATRLFVKKLAENDNSKNQVYLGGNFEVLNTLPYKEVYVDGGRTGSKRDRFKADLNLCWIDGSGELWDAPGAQLILYPKYPEVRMSGFLLKSKCAPSAMMASRLKKRIMFLGVCNDGRIIGHVTGPANPVGAQLDEQKNLEAVGVFFKIPLEKVKVLDTRGQLVKVLREIHEKGWLDAVRMTSDKSIIPYTGQNSGGYTLETHLGISPNGYAEPDYHGWEIKQHGVESFDKALPKKPITLFTPEPTAGVYREKGFDYFIRKYGYPDKNGVEDRLNFGGIHRFGTVTAITGLEMTMPGYDPKTGKIVDADGGIALLDSKGTCAAMWKFTDMMKHWNRKHAQVAYIPSLSRKEPKAQYWYGNKVILATGTDFLKLLKAVAAGVVYYDPACKIVGASTAKPEKKRRSQFRIKATDLNSLYDELEITDLISD